MGNRAGSQECVLERLDSSNVRLRSASSDADADDGVANVFPGGSPQLTFLRQLVDDWRDRDRGVEHGSAVDFALDDRSRNKPGDNLVAKRAPRSSTTPFIGAATISLTSAEFTELGRVSAAIMHAEPTSVPNFMPSPLHAAVPRI